MNHKICIQYGHNLILNILHKIKAKIHQNIPKIATPILYYATKKWRSRVIVEDNYQHIINKKIIRSNLT